MFIWLNKIWFNLRYYRYLKFKRTRLRKFSSYHKVFDHFYFNERHKIKDLKTLLNEILINKNLLKRLPRPVHEYRNFAKLVNDIEYYVRRYRIAKAVIDSRKFPKSFKIEIKRRDPSLTKFVDFYYKNRRTVDSILPQYKKYIDLLEFINANSDFQLEDTRANLLKQKIEIVKKLKDCRILNINLEKFILTVEVDSFVSMNKIGAMAWCITNEKDSWKEYVKKRKQIIVWNFSTIDTHPRHIVGITFNEKKKEIIHAYDAENEKIKTGKVYKYIVEAYGTKIHHK